MPEPQQQEKLDRGLMQAAVLVEPRRFEVKTLPLPEPGRSQIRIRVEGCGVCGSNLAPWEGKPWFKYPFTPGAPGHEGWGEVEALGVNATRFRIGERVAFLSCNAFAEFDVTEENNAVALPPSLEKKPVPGEALGCAVNVFRRCNIEPGQTVAVVGIGFLGALVANLAANAGAEVIAISRRQFALEKAKALGAPHTIPMEDHWKIIEQVKQLTRGTGCDCVIEAVGQQWPLDLAAELIKERGRLVIAGYHQDGPRQVNMQLWNWRGLDVINAHERDPKMYQQGMSQAIEAVAAGKLQAQSLYTHTFRLERINEAFRAMEQKPDDFLKALITI